MPTQYRPRLLVLGAVGVLAAATATAPFAVPHAFAQTTAPVTAADMPHSFAPLVNRVKPAVVNISTTELVRTANRNQLPQFQFPPGSPFGQMFRNFGMPNQGGGGDEDDGQGDGGQGDGGRGAPQAHEATALGSGFIVDPSGYIVTNNHVVKNGTSIEVTLQDGTTLKAKLVGHDDLTDLAVLKVSADHPLPYVSFGDSDQLQVGDWVVSVGNPFGLGGTVTSGILSARGRNIHEGPYDDFLQIDAPINQGNSGGPTFNEQGNVVGINTAIFSPNGGGSVGIGFAIPSNIAKPVVAELEKSGTVVRGFLGVAVQPITPQIEDALGVKSTNGALVAKVNADSPAAQAGLKPGDVIVKYGDTPVAKVRDLTWAVASTEPGKTVQVTYERSGASSTAEVKVGTLQPQGGQRVADAKDGQPRLGLELQGLTPEARQEYDLPRDLHGVLVVGVASGSPAERAGIQQGDIIERVNRDAVTSPRQVVDAVNAARSQGKTAVALSVNRSGQDEFVALAIANPDRS